jgi:hypothetical protein
VCFGYTVCRVPPCSCEVCIHEFEVRVQNIRSASKDRSETAVPAPSCRTDAGALLRHSSATVISHSTTPTKHRVQSTTPTQRNTAMLHVFLQLLFAALALAAPIASERQATVMGMNPSQQYGTIYVLRLRPPKEKGQPGLCSRLGRSLLGIGLLLRLLPNMNSSFVAESAPVQRCSSAQGGYCFRSRFH